MVREISPPSARYAAQPSTASGSRIPIPSTIRQPSFAKSKPSRISSGSSTTPSVRKRAVLGERDAIDNVSTASQSGYRSKTIKDKARSSPKRPVTIVTRIVPPSKSISISSSTSSSVASTPRPLPVSRLSLGKKGTPHPRRSLTLSLPAAGDQTQLMDTAPPDWLPGLSSPVSSNFDEAEVTFRGEASRAVMGVGRMMTPPNSQEIVSRPVEDLPILVDRQTRLPTPPSSQLNDDLPHPTSFSTARANRVRPRPAPTPPRKISREVLVSTTEDPSPNPRRKKSPRVEMIVQSPSRAKANAPPLSALTGLARLTGNSSLPIPSTPIAAESSMVNKKRPVPATAPPARRRKSTPPTTKKASPPKASRKSLPASTPKLKAKKSARKSLSVQEIVKLTGTPIGILPRSIEAEPGDDPLLLKAEEDDEIWLRKRKMSRSLSASLSQSSIKSLRKTPSSLVSRNALAGPSKLRNVVESEKEDSTSLRRSPTPDMAIDRSFDQAGAGTFEDLMAEADSGSYDLAYDEAPGWISDNDTEVEDETEISGPVQMDLGRGMDDTFIDIRRARVKATQELDMGAEVPSRSSTPARHVSSLPDEAISTTPLYSPPTKRDSAMISPHAVEGPSSNYVVPQQAPTSPSPPSEPSEEGDMTQEALSGEWEISIDQGHPVLEDQPDIIESSSPECSSPRPEVIDYAREDSTTPPIQSIQLPDSASHSINNELEDPEHHAEVDGTIEPAGTTDLPDEVLDEERTEDAIPEEWDTSDDLVVVPVVLSSDDIPFEQITKSRDVSETGNLLVEPVESEKDPLPQLEDVNQPEQSATTLDQICGLSGNQHDAPSHEQLNGVDEDKEPRLDVGCTIEPIKSVVKPVDIGYATESEEPKTTHQPGTVEHGLVVHHSAAHVAEIPHDHESRLLVEPINPGETGVPSDVLVRSTDAPSAIQHLTTEPHGSFSSIIASQYESLVSPAKPALASRPDFIMPIIDSPQPTDEVKETPVEETVQAALSPMPPTPCRHSDLLYARHDDDDDGRAAKVEVDNVVNTSASSLAEDTVPMLGDVPVEDEDDDAFEADETVATSADHPLHCTDSAPAPSSPAAAHATDGSAVLDSHTLPLEEYEVDEQGAPEEFSARLVETTTIEVPLAEAFDELFDKYISVPPSPDSTTSQLEDEESGHPESIQLVGPENNTPLHLVKVNALPSGSKSAQAFDSLPVVYDDGQLDITSLLGDSAPQDLSEDIEASASDVTVEGNSSDWDVSVPDISETDADLAAPAEVIDQLSPTKESASVTVLGKLQPPSPSQLPADALIEDEPVSHARSGDIEDKQMSSTGDFNLQQEHTAVPSTIDDSGPNEIDEERVGEEESIDDEGSIVEEDEQSEDGCSGADSDQDEAEHGHGDEVDQEQEDVDQQEEEVEEDAPEEPVRKSSRIVLRVVDKGIVKLESPVGPALVPLQETAQPALPSPPPSAPTSLPLPQQMVSDDSRGEPPALRLVLSEGSVSSTSGDQLPSTPVVPSVSLDSTFTPTRSPSVHRFANALPGGVSSLESMLVRRQSASSSISTRPSRLSANASTFEDSIQTPASSALGDRMFETRQTREEQSMMVADTMEESGSDSFRSVVEVSSLDPRAAARAAAILKLNHAYIEHGVLPSPSPTPASSTIPLPTPSTPGRSFPRTPRSEGRRRKWESKHFNTVESARKLNRDELLYEAEFEIVASRRSRSRSRAKSLSGASERGWESDETEYALPGGWKPTPGKRKRSRSVRARPVALPSVKESDSTGGGAVAGVTGEEKQKENVGEKDASRPWGVPDWKRLEKVFRAEKEAWKAEREVKPLPGLFGWARKAWKGEPEVKDWDNGRVVSRFLGEEKAEGLSGEWAEKMILLRVKALEKRVNAAPTLREEKKDKSDEREIKKPRVEVQRREKVPSTPMRDMEEGDSTVVSIVPPTTIRRMLGYVWRPSGDTSIISEAEADTSLDELPVFTAAPLDRGKGKAVDKVENKLLTRLKQAQDRSTPSSASSSPSSSSTQGQSTPMKQVFTGGISTPNRLAHPASPAWTPPIPGAFRSSFLRPPPPFTPTMPMSALPSTLGTSGEYSTPKLYPTLNPPYTQRSSALKALFDSPSTKTGEGRGMVLKKGNGSPSVLDLVKSFEEDGTFAKNHDQALRRSQSRQ